MLNTLQTTVGEVTLHVLSHTFAFYQISGWEHAHEGCAIAVTVVAGFWASVMVRMAFVVDGVALGALSLSGAICHFTASLYSVLPVASAVSWLQYQGIWFYHNQKLKEITGFVFMMLIIHRSTFHISWLYCIFHGTHTNLLCSVLLSVKSCFGIQVSIKGLKQLVRNRFGTHVYIVAANDLSSFRNLFHENLMA